MFEIEKLKQIANVLPPRLYPPDHLAPRDVRDAQKALIDAVSVARDYLQQRGIAWAGTPIPANSDEPKGDA